VIVAQKYPGAEEYRALPIPAVDVSYGRVFFNGRDGLGVDLVNNREANLRVGVSAFVRPDRKERFDRERLRGLGNIDVAPQVRAFVRKGFGAFEIGALGSRDIGGSDGATLDLNAAYRTPVGRAFLSVGPTISIADDRFAREWFGITPAQATRGARQAYSAKGGIYQVSGSVALVAPLSRRWTLAGFGGYAQLVGDAADSPVVGREGGPIGGVTLSYRFR
jgi:outer membrane protein